MAIYIKHSIPCCRNCVYLFKDIDTRACTREGKIMKFIGQSRIECKHYKEKVKEFKPNGIHSPGACGGDAKEKKEDISG